MNEWISVKDRTPEPETEVLILAKRKHNGHLTITTAIYEDGTINGEDSVFCWDNLEDWGTYDADADCYRISQGWWEYRHYNSEEAYNNIVDDEVIYWMPLPEAPKGE